MKKTYNRHSDNKELDSSEDELSFSIWKAELNKELFSFWKSITEENDE